MKTLNLITVAALSGAITIGGTAAVIMTGAEGILTGIDVLQFRTALSQDEGVPQNLVTALNQDEGVPQNLIAALEEDEGVPPDLVTALSQDEGVPQDLVTALREDEGVPRDGVPRNLISAITPATTD